MTRVRVKNSGVIELLSRSDKYYVILQPIMSDIFAKISDRIKRDQFIQRKRTLFSVVGAILMIAIVTGPEDPGTKFFSALGFLVALGFIIYPVFLRYWSKNAEPINCSACGYNLQPYVTLLQYSGCRNRKIIEWFASPIQHPESPVSLKHCPNCGASLGSN